MRADGGSSALQDVATVVGDNRYLSAVAAATRTPSHSTAVEFDEREEMESAGQSALIQR